VLNPACHVYHAQQTHLQHAAQHLLQVMAYPVVGVLWGMARFKEFRQGSKASLALIAAQVAAYSTAVALLASSAELRSGGNHR
jgi:hypothetical protein